MGKARAMKRFKCECGGELYYIYIARCAYSASIDDKNTIREADLLTENTIDEYLECGDCSKKYNFESKEGKYAYDVVTSITKREEA